MTRLAGAHVLVTGGSEGIGLEVARSCLRKQATVTILSRSSDKLAAAAAELGTVRTVPADVTDEGALRLAIAQVEPVDVLVAAAGGAEPGHFDALDTATLRRGYELNYLGAVYVVRAVLPSMLERERGHVVLVSSAAALTGVFGYGAYGPAKAALVNLAEVLDAEYADRGLRLAVAYPPDTLTPGYERENRTKPAQTQAVSALVQPLTASAVATAIVRGIERDRRTITADAGTALLARASPIAGPIVRAAMRRAARRSTPD